jgi:hypothetical protein
MMQQSGGSQPSSKQFLGAYASGVEEAIRELQSIRRPAVGAAALTGAQSMTAADALAGKV